MRRLLLSQLYFRGKWDWQQLLNDIDSERKIKQRVTSTTAPVLTGGATGSNGLEVGMASMRVD